MLLKCSSLSVHLRWSIINSIFTCFLVSIFSNLDMRQKAAILNILLTWHVAVVVYMHRRYFVYWISVSPLALIGFKSQHFSIQFTSLPFWICPFISQCIYWNIHWEFSCRIHGSILISSSDQSNCGLWSNAASLKKIIFCDRLNSNCE